MGQKISLIENRDGTFDVTMGDRTVKMSMSKDQLIGVLKAAYMTVDTDLDKGALAILISQLDNEA